MDEIERFKALQHYLAIFNAISAYRSIDDMKATCAFCSRPRHFGAPHINCGIISRIEWGLSL